MMLFLSSMHINANICNLFHWFIKNIFIFLVVDFITSNPLFYIFIILLYYQISNNYYRMSNNGIGNKIIWILCIVEDIMIW